MPRALQYLDSSQTTRLLVPLLALHPMQHLAMFSRVIAMLLDEVQKLFNREGRTPPMSHRMTIGAERAHVYLGIHEPLTAC